MQSGGYEFLARDRVIWAPSRDAESWGLSHCLSLLPSGAVTGFSFVAKGSLV